MWNTLSEMLFGKENNDSNSLKTKLPITREVNNINERIIGVDKKKNTYQRIYQIIKRIPVGKVATYGLIAQIEGTCTPRMVGYALYNVKVEMQLPWHRVINSSGRISLKEPEGNNLQRAMLESEGVVFSSGRVDLERFLWKP